MKNKLFGLGVLCLMVSSLPVNSQENVQKVIYGEDDRQDVYEVADQKLKNWARSTAGRIAPNSLKWNGIGQYLIAGGKLSSEMICSSESFANQTAAADCSGFLVGKDLLMTAGHCMTGNRDCSDFKWVFDYKVDPNSDTIVVSEEAVYGCKEIIASKDDYSSMMDYALIRLDREVNDREPLKLRSTGAVQENKELVIIGHPSGLPSKISTNAFLRDNDNPIYFSANLDSYGGNSGSAVIDRETGLVEGILVRGEEDYVFNYNLGCRESNRCENDECMGEEVTRATVVLNEIKDKITL